MRICVRFKGWSLSLLFVLLMPAQVLAQDQVVVPNDFENTTGTHAFLSPTANSPRTYQLLIHEDQLADLSGQRLAGVAWRLPDSASADWPAVDVVYDNYDIYLSESVAPADRSLTFADNVVGPQTQVRAGSLTIPAGAFTSGASPNAFSFLVEFDPWLYEGGHLLVELRHTGQDQNSRSNDAVGTANPGYLNQFAAVWQSGYDAVGPGSQGNFAITQFTALAGFQVSPSSIELAMFPDDPPATEVLELLNSGDEPVTWNIETAEPGDCDNPAAFPWITGIVPDSGTLAAGAGETVDVTIAPDGLDPGDTYQASLCVSSDDPTAPLVDVPVTLTVIDPDAAILEGTVNSVGFCGHADPIPLEGAQVLIEGQLDDYTVFTDADGFYQIDLDIAESPVDITVTDPDHLPGIATGVALAGGGTVVEDFDLSGDSACIDVDPAQINATLDIGDTVNETVDIGNVGTQPLEWSLFESGVLARGGDSDPLIGLTFKTTGSSGADPQNWTRIGVDQGMAANLPDDTGAPTDVSVEWGLLPGSGSMLFIAEGTVAADAVPLYDYDLRGMNGYAFGSGGHYFVEFSGLEIGRPYEVWFVGFRAISAIDNLVQISNGDDPAAITFSQTLTAGNNDGRFIVNEVVADNTMHFNDLAIVTEASSAGTIRFEVQGVTQSTVMGAIAIREALNCELPDWITSITPDMGTVPVGPGTDELTVTLDAGGLAPGTYTDAFCIASNDPSRPVVAVPVTLEVELGDFTAVEGTVTTAGYCNADPGPLAGATVEIFNSGGTLVDTLTTDENGFYETFLHSDEGPLDIEVSAAGHLDDQATGVGTDPGATVTRDFELLLEVPCATVDPPNFTFNLLLGNDDSDTLTIGNVEGNAVLEWTIEVAEPPSAGNGNQPEPAGGLAVETGGLPETAAEDPGMYFDENWPGPDTNVPRIVDCDSEPGIIIHDNGTINNGYSGNPAVVDSVAFVDRFTPDEYPRQFTAVCVAFRGNGGPTMDFELVVFADDGDGGAPGTELGAIATTALDIPPSGTPAPVWQTVDISSLDILISSGSVYIGARWSPPDPNVFIGGDESTSNAGGYWWNNNAGVWAPIQTGFPGYRALFVRAVAIDATGCTDPDGADWLTVTPVSGDVAPGATGNVDVMVTTMGLTHGTYQAFLCIASNDPVNGLIPVPVTLNVTDPDAGTLGGTVTSAGHCNADPHPIAGALVTAVGQTMTFEATTDENGEYMIPGINEDESPLEVTVTAAGYLDGMETGVMITAQQTTTVDFELVLDAPCATVDPEIVEAEVGQGGTTSRTLVIGNEAGGADLSWTIQTAEPASSPEPAAMPTADTGVSSDGGFAAEDLASILGEALPSVPVVNPAGGVVDCDNEPGLIIHDDGTVENGYSYLTTVAWGAFIDRFTPDAYPVVFDSVCLAFVRAAGGPASMDFEIIVYADDGPGGAPGTELGVMQANVQGIPEWPISTPTWASFDISSLDIQIESGSVYIGARWVPSSPNVFLAADQSEDRPVGFAGGYTATSNNPDWQLTHTAGATFEPYRSMFIRAVASEAGACANPTDIPWLSVDPEAGNTPAGGTSQVTVHFDATGLELGVHEALLCVNSNDANNPRIEVPVTLSVLDLPPGELELTPSTLDFGTVEVGTTATGELTLTNIGEDTFPVLVDGILVTGATFADTGDGSCEAGTTELASGQSCTIEIAFTPTAETAFSGGVVVDGADGKLATASLTGIGVEDGSNPGILLVDPAALDFGEVPMGDLATMSFVISNAGAEGAEPLLLTVMDMAAGGHAFEMSGGDCSTGMMLEPADSCTIEVTFGPAEITAYSGTALVATDDGQDAEVSLSGSGIEPGGDIFADRFEVAEQEE